MINDKGIPDRNPVPYSQTGTLVTWRACAACWLETAFDTIFTVADAGSLVEGTDRLQPTVIVVDLAVANGDFAGLIRRLRKSSPASKVIALSVNNDPAVIDALLSAGADGVVLKHMIAGDLMVAIDKTLEGGSFGIPDTGPI
jgi:DNA-binding NarL/FixJ family response regulator